MNALLFPGQGSQVVGMGKEFYQEYDLVKKLFKDADEQLGLKISKLILEGPENELQLTKNTQPAILTVSYSIFQVLKKEFNFVFNNFEFFAGHSLGEYSALVCAESLNFQDAIFLLHERGKAMQNAVEIGKGKMIAVLGPKIEEIKNLMKIVEIEKGVCEIANDNADGQVILSGDINSVTKIQNILKQKKIKSIPLKVSAPFHCSLMKKASDNMSEKILNTEFKQPTFKIINNVTAKPEVNIEKLKRLLIDQIFSSVRWRETLILMSKNGVKNFVEIGPGKALCGMVKRTIQESNCFSINSIADIKNYINESKK